MDNTVVYITTNLKNGKKYIGSDSNNDKYYYGSGVNLKKAIKKYGKKNFKKNILWSGPKEFLREMEEYYCEYYNTQKSNLFYNCTNKGTGSIKGQPHLAKYKPIHQWDLKGNLIKNWSSYTEATRITGIQTIGSALIGKQKSAGGYIWTKENVKPIPQSEWKKRDSKKLGQYNDNNTLIKVFKSTWSAGKEIKTDSANIRNACLNKCKAKGYYWKFI